MHKWNIGRVPEGYDMIWHDEWWREMLSQQQSQGKNNSDSNSKNK